MLSPIGYFSDRLYKNWTILFVVDSLFILYFIGELLLFITFFCSGIRI
jgi:hypothetical protein